MRQSVTAIRGQRVTLRPPQQGDAEESARVWTPELRHMYGGSLTAPGLATVESRERRFQRALQGEEGHFFCIEADGRYIGFAIIGGIDQANQRGRYRVGIENPDYWGRGFGTEVTRLMLRCAFRTIGLHRVDLRVAAYNKRAIRCYQKSGFRLEGVERDSFFVDGEWHDDLLMAALRDEWLAEDDCSQVRTGGDAALTNRIEAMVSKSLQVRRMLQRGETDVLPLPVAELALLGRELEATVSAEQLTAASRALARQRWHKSRAEVTVREGYGKWSRTYDSEVNPLIVVEEPIVLDLVGDVAGKDVLDAACGTGRYAIRLAQAGARVSGIDLSEDMLARAKVKRDALGLDIDLLAGDLTRLPYPGASFDLAICALALCHVPDISKPIGEFARVLRPGGRLIVSDFHPCALVVGWRTRFDDPATSYFIENHTHLIADHLDALRANGLKLTDLREEVVDDRLNDVIGSEGVERFRGMPVALMIAAVKKGATS